MQSANAVLSLQKRAILRKMAEYPIQRIASYAVVDPVIQRWCKAHSLMLFTDYKDYDVRSVDVVGPTGAKCQVWVDPPQNDNVTIHIWPYAPPHERMTIRIEDFAEALEKAYILATSHLG